MTIRDHRLTAAAKRWQAASVLAPPRRRTERTAKAITKRAKRSTDTKKDTKEE